MATASEDPNLTIRASACSEFEAEFHACEAGIWRRRAATSDKFPKPPGARFVRMEDWNPWAARPKKAEKKSPWAAECFFGGRLPSAHGRVAEVTPSIFSSHLHRHSPTRQRAVLTSGRAKPHAQFAGLSFSSAVGSSEVTAMRLELQSRPFRKSS
jgi:hypothetical protein